MKATKQELLQRSTQGRPSQKTLC